jgi:hypothetical protein
LSRNDNRDPGTYWVSCIDAHGAWRHFLAAVVDATQIQKLASASLNVALLVRYVWHLILLFSRAHGSHPIKRIPGKKVPGEFYGDGLVDFLTPFAHSFFSLERGTNYNFDTKQKPPPRGLSVEILRADTANPSQAKED